MLNFDFIGLDVYDLIELLDVDQSITDWIVIEIVRILKLLGVCGKKFRIRVGFDPMFAFCRYVLESGWYSVKKEGEKNKANSTVTWHKIECEETRQKSKANVPVYNFNKMRRRGRPVILVRNQKQVPLELSRTTQLT